MTNPEGFQYRDDSIVAKIAVDVPASTLTDLDQVKERASSLRVELEAIARASGDWLGSLQQAPALAEQAAQSYRNMITQLERISYIQSEMGGSHPNIGVSGSPMQGSGPQPYSTAAPAGYVDPFMGMPGTGMGMGMQGAQTYMQSMMMNDPRMFANMAAARGNYVNPAQLGLMGGQLAASQGISGGTGGGMGQGAASPGSLSPQATQRLRDSAAPPDPTQRGQPSTSEPQDDSAEPHPDSPQWQQSLSAAKSTAKNVFNEVRSKGVTAGTAAIMKGIGRLGGQGGGDDGGDGQGPPGGGGGGGLGSKLGGIAKGVGIGGVALGLGVKGMEFVQDAGEQVQQYKNLGAVRGGGFEEGLGYEMNARIMSMNPFLTLDQSRQVYQSALKNGYNGKQFENVVDFMADNLTKMNISVGESAQLLTTNVDKGKMSVTELGESLASLKESSKTGEQSFGEKRKEYEANSATLAGAGLTGQDLDSTAKTITEAFAGSRQLKAVGGDSVRSLLGSSKFLTMVGQQNGAPGVLPSAVLPTLQDQGKDEGRAIFDTIKWVVETQVKPSAGADRRKGASLLMQVMAMYDTPMDFATAQAFYDSVVQGEDFGKEGAKRTQQAEVNKRISDKGFFNSFSRQVSSDLGEVGTPFGTAASAIGNFFSGKGEESMADLKKLPGQLVDALPGIGGGSAQKRAEAALADAQATRGGGTSNVTGTVNGELKITVDQSGKVTAPQSVQLSGSQKGTYAGYGSGTVNNAGPGDPAYQNSMPPLR